MAYQLKTVRYQNSDCKILLQNENGPCPLLAAANALLLKGVISLPSESIRSGVASIDDVVNVLAERALALAAAAGSKSAHGGHDEDKDDSGADHHMHELLSIFPNLQYGMDVNPKFTAGVTGVEYTSNLVAFDMLNVELVHGWLLDPQDRDTVQLVGSKTYNELIEVVVQGKEASIELETLSKAIAEREAQLLQEMGKEEEGWVNVATESGSSVVDTTSTSPLDEKRRPPAKDDELEESVLVVNESAQEDSSAEKMKQEETIYSQSVAKEGEAVEASAEDAAELEQEPNADEQTVEVTEPAHPPRAEETTDSTIAPENKETAKETQASNASDAEALLDEENKKAKLERELAQLQETRNELATLATNASLIDSFLCSTGHQLTHYGLHELYSHVGEESLCVFFRNNHFGTLTKHKGVLFLLVTDLGYANVPEVMWEKLDGIDGDTEYCNAAFVQPAPQAMLAPAAGPLLSPEHVLAQRGQSEADFQLALQLSQNANSTAVNNMDEDEGKLVAAATEASLRTYNGLDTESKTEEEQISMPTTNGIMDGCSTQEDSDKLMAMHLQAQMDNESASLHLARKLQNEERQAVAAARNHPHGRPAAKASNCVIS